MLAGQLGMRMVNQLLYEGVITSGDLHIATRDGEAMFFHDSIDFSAYAGTDGGSTPYRFVFTDSAGKVATAYGGAAGGGEALGSELIANGTFDSDVTGWTAWIYEPTIESVAGGVSNNCLHLVNNGTNWVHGAAKTSLSIFNGRIYKISCFIKKNTSAVQIRITNVTSNIDDVWVSSGTLTDTSWTEYNCYATPSISTGGYVILVAINPGGGDAYFDELSVKPITDVPATGLHLMSTKNGTTRNMASVETGFDPNAIVGVQIYG